MLIAGVEALIDKLIEYSQKYYWRDLKDKEYCHHIKDGIIKKRFPEILKKSKETKIYQMGFGMIEKLPVRVIGFRSNQIFYLICIDYKHEIFPMS